MLTLFVIMPVLEHNSHLCIQKKLALILNIVKMNSYTYSRYDKEEDIFIIAFLFSFFKQPPIRFLKSFVIARQKGKLGGGQFFLKRQHFVHGNLNP